MKKFSKHIDTKLTKRMKIYLGISVIMLAIVIYEVIISGIQVRIAGGIFFCSSIAGFFLSRIFHIYRDEKEQVVTSRIDTLGGILLGCYIALSIGRHYIIHLFVQQSLVIVITFTVISGIMIGRYIGLRKRILSTIKNNDIL